MFSKLNKAIEAVTAFYTEGFKDMIQIQLDYNKYLNEAADYNKRVVRLAFLKEMSTPNEERKEEHDFLEWYIRKYPAPIRPEWRTKN